MPDIPLLISNANKIVHKLLMSSNSLVVLPTHKQSH